MVEIERILSFSTLFSEKIDLFNLFNRLFRSFNQLFRSFNWLFWSFNRTFWSLYWSVNQNRSNLDQTRSILYQNCDPWLDFFVDFELDRNRRSNSDFRFNSMMTIWFATPNRISLVWTKSLSNFITMSYPIRRDISLMYFYFGLSSLQTLNVIPNRLIANSNQNWLKIPNLKWPQPHDNLITN